MSDPFFMTTVQILSDLRNLIGPGVEIDNNGLKRWVNDSYMAMVDEITKVRPEYFTKSSTTATVSGQQEYDLPNDWEKVLLVNIQYSGTWKKALPMGNADIHHILVHSDANNLDGFSTAQPYYYLIGDNIGFAPTPTETVASAIKVWYVYTPVELDGDDDVPAFPAKYHHIIKYGAYANYLDQDDEHVAAERMRNRFDERVRLMVESMSEQQVDVEKSVTVTTNQDLYTDNTFI